MKEKSDRRSFIRHLGIGGLGVTLAPDALLQLRTSPDALPVSDAQNITVENPARIYNSPYTGPFLNRVAFPIGGIGAGMFCLEGGGAVSHFSVRHKPEIFNEPGWFAAISVKGLPNGTKVVEGPVPDWKKFGLRDAGNGLGGATTGLPRFHQAAFTAQFPFGIIDLKDEDLPLEVAITGWSPFIPGDENNSSLPVGALEYTFRNTGRQAVEAVFSYNAKNALKVQGGKNAIRSMAGGFILSEQGTAEKRFLQGDFAIFTDDEQVVVDHCWFRGGWWDPLTMVWNTIKGGETNASAPVEADAPGASLFVPFRLEPAAEKTVRVLMAWYVPESDLTYGTDGNREAETGCDPASGCCNSPNDIGLGIYDGDYEGKYYKPWYSNRFSSIAEVSAYWKEHYGELRQNSQLFTEAFYASTLPSEVMEAVACNLSILKSPTVLRQFDGRLWSFEGCGDSWGCCHGSCTHVWNYAQAIPHLFPALERTLRNTEFCESQNKEGHQNFRSAFPIQPASHGFHAAADGQLGGIMKVYREWRISGDNDWMRKIFPMVKVSMDYCIRTWDPKQKGIIEEPHHNTYDIEFWGPDGMHSSFYLGALQAIVAMGKYLGKDMHEYEILAEKGRQFMETQLFNGEYFFQRIQYTGLEAADPLKVAQESMVGNYSEEAKALLEKEGPKYQYGTGCLSDGILGAWIARMCGLADPADPQKITSHLLAVHKYNLKDNLSDHANPQRPTFALGEEGGLLLCSWPKGGMLSLPFVYSNEVWTGIEHQVAAHLMLMGQVEEGLEVVRLSRNRYDGQIRNPFDEYECGHWYARALASYGYLQALTGVRFDAVEKILYVDSKVGDFTSFLATATGFGTVSWKDGKVELKVAYGTIPVEKLMVSGKSSELQKQ